MSSMAGWHYVLLALCLVATTGLHALGDATDWVSVGYIVEEARRSLAGDTSPTTEQALESIVRGADHLVSKGPWSVANDRSVLPPSKDARDYLSWAP
ncbi:hypothetical protein NMY22_g16906 [Coprinellus aureogranulatus]|nr:hypothetical protein NMY22_g16906 [Coprinellus aureogranulatus]